MLQTRKTIFVLIALLTLCTATWVWAEKPITVSEVSKNIDKTVTVEGKVIKVGESKSGGTYFLDFSSEPKGFTVVIFKSVAESIAKSGVDLKSLAGKTVQVTGKIVNDPKYGMEIKLEKAADLNAPKSTTATKSTTSPAASSAKTEPAKTTGEKTAASTGVIPYTDAMKNAGQIKTVEGKVVSVGASKTGSVNFINFSKQRGDLAIVIFKQTAEEFKKANIDLKSFEGKTIQVTGKIDNNPKYGLQIIVNKPSEIKIIK